MNPSTFKQTALSAAKQAGKILLHYYGRKEKTKQKPNKSLVATADLEANKTIIKIIKKKFPHHNILSEETAFEDNKSDYKWVIDPLDGTHNFLHKIPFFGTSIALEYKNEAILGVLNFPILSLMAIAEKGNGAFLNGKKLRVSSKNNLDHSFILVELAYANRIEKIDFLKNFIDKPVDVRNFGSAVYNALLVACGNCDGYITLSVNEWDIAAGFLIIEEAGGKVTDLKGRKWDKDGHKFVATNGKIHNVILKYLK